MAFALLIALSLLTLGTAYHFSHNWFPAAASLNAAALDRQLWLNFVVLGAVFVITQITLAIFVWRYRARPNRGFAKAFAKPAAGSGRVEWMAVICATVIFIGLNISTSRALATAEYLGPSSRPDPVHVEVTGVQFRWYFRYPGADGKFGATKPELVDASLGNPLGLDHSDPASNDDRVVSTLMVPAGRDVELSLRAQDVIHSFFVPSLRLKQDAVPGMEMHLHFNARTPGTYDIACAELCGLGHYSMSAKMIVVSPDRFRAFEREGTAMVALK